MDSSIQYGKDAFTTYSGYTPEEIDAMRDKYQFTPRLMLNTLRTLYEEPERFPRIMDYMKEAAPGSFFEEHLGDRYEIAQKYGQYEGVLHTAGVIYTPTPIILVVMCDHVRNQDVAIASLAEFFSDYSLTLDARVEASRKQQEEEERRLAQEEAARVAEAEAQKQAELQEAARLAEEAKLQQVAADAEKASRSKLTMVLLSFAMAALCLLSAYLVSRREKRRKKKKARR